MDNKRIQFQTYAIRMISNGEVMSIEDVKVFDGLGEMSFNFTALIKITSAGAVNVRLSAIILNPVSIYSHTVANSHMWNPVLLPKN